VRRLLGRRNGRSEARDMTPALGHAGGPASWERAVPDGKVGLARADWHDARWSFLFQGEDSAYATAAPDGDGPMPELEHVQGPMMKPPVWTWEVPLYFWFGGMTSGASFVGLACDLAGDHRSARVARAVALAAVLPCPVLLVLDLGRPLRFLNMLRIFKPRSPMSMGAWCLVSYSVGTTLAVGADLVLKDRFARATGVVNALLGGYLGSYTGVLLASTAVPVWARSHLFLGPIFICTAAATGAAACRFALVGTGLPSGHPTREALGRVETGAMATELILSQVNEVRLGRLSEALETGPAGRWMTSAKWLVRTGITLRLARARGGPWTHHVASACYLGAALCFRYGWVTAGRQSARDDEAVARMARARATEAEPGADVTLTRH
jgi:formate-dependent nitrite reductase membrane component NrfD